MPRNNGYQKHTGSLRKEKKTSFSYTDEERETLRRGLRMLARLIARVHMRRQLSTHKGGAADSSKDHVP